MPELFHKCEKAFYAMILRNKVFQVFYAGILQVCRPAQASACGLYKERKVFLFDRLKDGRNSDIRGELLDSVNSSFPDSS